MCGGRGGDYRGGVRGRRKGGAGGEGDGESGVGGETNFFNFFVCPKNFGIFAKTKD